MDSDSGPLNRDYQRIHQEATLLRGSAYRQQIAEALLNGVMKYQRSLKASPQTVSSQ